MVENQNGGQNASAPAAVKKMVKVPMVKRVKTPASAPAAPAARQPQAVPPAAPKIIQPETSDTEPPLPPEEDFKPVRNPIEEQAGSKPIHPASRSAAQPAAKPAAQPASAAQPAAKPAAQPVPAAEPQQPAKPAAESAETEKPAEEQKQGEAVPEKKEMPQGGSPLDAGKITARKRRRDVPTPENAAKKKAQQALNDAKRKAESLKKNKWVRLFVFLLIICGILGGVYSYLPVLAEKKLPEILAANGFKLKTFKVKELSINAMELTGITDQSGTLSISSMKADYSLKDLLMESKLKSLNISGLTVTGVRRDDGVSLGAFGGLLASSTQVKKGLELDLPKISVGNSKFVLQREREQELLDENGEPVDETMTVNFSATGKMRKSVLDMTFSTDYESPQMRVKTTTVLKKSTDEAEIKTEITEGDVLKQPVKTSNDTEEEPAGEPEVIGSVNGTMEFSVKEGVLTKGVGNLALKSSSQTLTLDGEVVPHEKGFDLSLKLNRSFEDKKDAEGKIVGDLTIEAKNLEMKGKVQKFSGKLPLKVSATSLSSGNVLIQQLKVAMNLLMDCEDAKCRFRLQAPMPVAFNSAIVNGKFRQFKFFQPVSVRINPDPKEDFLTTDGGALNFTLPLSGFTAQLFVADRVENRQVGLAMNASKMHLKTNVFSSGYSGDFTFGQSYYTDKDVKASGVQGAFTFDSKTLPSGRMIIADIEAKQKGILPNFSADVALKPMGTDEYSVKSALSVQNGLVTVSAEGAYALAAHRWNLYVNIPKVILSETGLPLESVLPFMAGKLSKKTTGAFAAKGRVTVERGKMSGPVTVLLENIGTQWNGMDLNGVNGVVTLSSLLPLETPENQMLFVGRLNVGVPFGNALFNFKVVADRGVQMANMRMQFADGQFKTIKPFFYPYDGSSSAILMEGNGIDLQTLTRGLKSSALQADGTLNSEWKLSFGEKGLQIDQAKLITKLPGTLHFDPSVKVRKTMDADVVKFLSEVIVKQMGVTIQGSMDGMLTFKTKIVGHSPLEQNNKTVQFEFANSFKNLLKDDSAAIDLPSDVMLSIQNFMK